MRGSKLPDINLDYTLREPEAWRLGLMLAKQGTRFSGIMASPPSLNSVVDFMEKAGRNGLNIRRLEVDFDAPGGPRLLAIAESHVHPNRLAEKLKKVAENAGLKSIRLIGELAPGLWINTAVFPILAGSERIIGLRSGSLAGMASRLKARMGAGAEILYFHEGRLYGEESARLYMSVLGKVDPSSIVSAFLAGIQVLGRAKPVRVTTLEEGYVFVLEDAWDALEVNCSHTRGTIVGLLSTILNMEFTSRVKVEDDHRCIIEVRPLRARKHS